MWRLRGDAGSVGDGRWKITARYDVWLKPNVCMRCIRVSHYGRPYTVRHFSEAEFLRLYVLTGPPHQLPAPDIARTA